jgi:hypothetical protein
MTQNFTKEVDYQHFLINDFADVIEENSYNLDLVGESKLLDSSVFLMSD